jgi:preprotein translocase subunit Sec61beta
VSECLTPNLVMSMGIAVTAVLIGVAVLVRAVFPE